MFPIRRIEGAFLIPVGVLLLGNAVTQTADATNRCQTMLGKLLFVGFYLTQTLFGQKLLPSTDGNTVCVGTTSSSASMAQS